MKKVALAAALSVAATTAFAGGYEEPIIEPEIIVDIPPELAQAIIKNRGWVFPLPPTMLDKVKANQS